MNEALVRRVAVALMHTQLPGVDPESRIWTADGLQQLPGWRMYEVDARAAIQAVLQAQAAEPKPEALEALARELWEAHATHHQQVINFPQEHWDETDPFTKDHWRVISRTALAFRPR